MYSQKVFPQEGRPTKLVKMQRSPGQVPRVIGDTLTLSLQGPRLYWALDSQHLLHGTFGGRGYLIQGLENTAAAAATNSHLHRSGSLFSSHQCQDYFSSIVCEVQYPQSGVLMNTNYSESLKCHRKDSFVKKTKP